MAELDSFPNQQPQDSDEVVAAHDSNGDGTLDDTVNWTWSEMKAALNSAGYARTDQDEVFEGKVDIDTETVVNSVSELTASGNGKNTDWNQDYHHKVVGANNALTFTVPSDTNKREAAIQAGHSAGSFSDFRGDLYLNPVGGAVIMGGGENSTTHAQGKLLTNFSDPTVFSAREVKSGTSAPSDSEGKNGDIYIQTN